MEVRVVMEAGWVGGGEVVVEVEVEVEVGGGSWGGRVSG
jgi:hypothetical protein